MQIDLYIVENCPACKRAKELLEQFTAKQSDINFAVIDLNKSNAENVQIIPALFVNGKLFSYGEVDVKRLEEVLSGGR